MSRVYGINKVIAGAYEKGFQDGIRLIEERLLLASEKGTPIEINGRAWWIQSDLDNLRSIFTELESEEGK